MKNIFIFFLLIIIVSISQFILADKILQFGFFTDDWLFLSSYRANIINPFLDIYSMWKAVGSHIFSYSYYQGILYTFFGLDYFAHRLVNLIFKILATLSLYPLILYLSKRKLVAFLATFIYGIHYSTFGLLDGASRGGNFIAIALMNLFLLAYFYIIKKNMFNIFLLFGFAILLFTTILFSTTRLFPLLLIVPLIEVLNFIWEKKGGQIILSIKRLSVLYSPLIFLFIFSPGSITQQLRYSIGLFDKLRDGNWQLFLTPFAALGSTYIPKEFFPLFGNPSYQSFDVYLSFFLFGPLFVYCIIFSLLGLFISRRPLKFIMRSLGLNFMLGIIVYLIANNWLSLNPATKAPVDPGTFLLPALIGLFIMSVSLCLFLEWKESEKKDNLLPFLFLAPLFSLIFIFLTWILADINSIFMGVHAYLTIPAIGTSVFLAVILTLIYNKLMLFHFFGRNKVIALSLIIFMLFLYIKLSASSVDKFLSYWLNNGLRATDQQRIQNQFWQEVGYHKQYSWQNRPLIYFDSLSDPVNGTFYSESIIWQLASWFDLRFKQNKDGRFSLGGLMVLDKANLEKSVRISKDRRTIIRDNGAEKDFYKIEDFYAFKLMNRNLIPIKEEILRDLKADN